MQLCNGMSISIIKRHILLPFFSRYLMNYLSLMFVQSLFSKLSHRLHCTGVLRDEVDIYIYEKSLRIKH